ncbi:phosphoglucosamine mutase [Aureliella helgolandensis]|uniref:Phosphoglucosamine mutase n=1 Tax=Aureliella helgolandensis TaxID=2527968 RepID=A0A518GDL4_9BACT|nr:phosphoglucosamine mutase [Aureliella helgolandensis]QDV26638.1 Phosphoglucosamine mutase [Aureliella helgolandensis]
MSEPIISVSGLRGLIGEQLTPVVAARYVAAMVAALQTSLTSTDGHRGKIVVARDGRNSGQMLARAVTATIVASGLDAIDLDVASTPTVGVQIQQLKAVGGVQISASHNPKEYNGLKLFGPDGRVLTKSIGERVLEAYRAGHSRWVGVDELGQVESMADPHLEHMQRVLATIDAPSIQQQHFKVLLDSNHGAGSLLGRRLLEALGCEVTVLGEAPHGAFAHPPEPVADNLQGVCAQVRAGGFKLGFCQDPDADRLAVIDELGNYIGEEMTLALCLMQVLPQHPGTIVTNCATSGLARALSLQYDCPLLQSAVGEANVADLMIAEGAVFGGEGNGGPIDPQVGYVRDSFVGMARILDLLSSRKTEISHLVSELPPLAIVKDKVTMEASQLPEFWKRLTAAMTDAKASQPDGLKLDWEDRWLLVRGSNTEPIVRLIAEAPSVAEAQALCDRAKQLL